MPLDSLLMAQPHDLSSTDIYNLHCTTTVCHICGILNYLNEGLKADNEILTLLNLFRL